MDIEGTIKKINMMNDNKERFRLFCELQQYLYLLPKLKCYQLMMLLILVSK